MHFPIQRIGGSAGEMYGNAFGTSAAGQQGGGGGNSGPGNSGAGAGAAGGQGGAGGSSGRWVLIANESEANVITEGLPGSDQITYTDLVESYVEEWVVPPSAGGGGTGPTITLGDYYPGGPGAAQPTTNAPSGPR